MPFKLLIKNSLETVLPMQISFICLLIIYIIIGIEQINKVNSRFSITSSDSYLF